MTTRPDDGTDGGAPRRLVGVRTPYEAAPPGVHAWAEQTLGAPIVEVQPRTGGMSPAVAASVRAANGATAFIKAVGDEINPDTPTHFRHEVEVLSRLPSAPYRVDLLSTYDDGRWVALALEDIDGRHPDWRSEHDRSAVFEAVRRQTAELTPAPAGLPAATYRSTAEKYLDALRDATPSELAGLPRWALDELPSLIDLVSQSLDRYHDDSFCHWDIRDDNIVIRHRDGQPFLVDWGMSRRGRRWGDIAIFALEWVDSPEFDAVIDAAGLDLDADEQLDITAFLAGAGCFLCMRATHPPPQGLPQLPEFGRQMGIACLQGVRRRLR